MWKNHEFSLMLSVDKCNVSSNILIIKLQKKNILKMYYNFYNIFTEFSKKKVKK